MNLEELQEENKDLKKEIEKLQEQIKELKDNEYVYTKTLRHIFSYCTDIEKNLKNIQSDMDYVYKVTRMDWNE